LTIAVDSPIAGESAAALVTVNVRLP
jgi:hypothetical protein